MPSEGAKSAEERLAKLEKGIGMLRVALALVAVVFAIALVILGIQVREQATATAEGQTGTAARPVGASRFTLVEVVTTTDPKGKKEQKSVRRAELGFENGAPCLRFFDASGAVTLSVPAGAAAESTPPKESSKKE
ncbi:MAG: hypothetical protein FJ291_01705 [Planctomycetes bacterium]|nr:hypothetical protein [Planctomycetota bacterium]